MTIALFSEWIGNLNESMEKRGKNILLILDNASSHKAIGVNLTNVRVLMLPPITTAFLQPMDAGIISSFKHAYRRRQMEHAIRLIDMPTSDFMPGKKLYAVDVLVVLRRMTKHGMSCRLLQSTIAGNTQAFLEFPMDNSL